MRLALCCQFMDEPIKFRTTTVSSLMKMSREDALKKTAALCLHNARALQDSIRACERLGIQSFRVNSAILPCKTHQTAGYDMSELPDGKEIIKEFELAGDLASQEGIRLTFHPDQFVVLGSPREEVVDRSIEDLEYHAMVSEWIGADVINIHGGGAYGNKPEALDRVRTNFKRLSESVRERITFENDDKIFNPTDLLPLCNDLGVPLVYDVHHHRCHPDELSIEQATQEALKTWNDREPLFHISSPKEGWDGPNPLRHHDYIDPQDFPTQWLELDITVDVEAKAKERALIKLMADIVVAV